MSTTRLLPPRPAFGFDRDVADLAEHLCVREFFLQRLCGFVSAARMNVRQHQRARAFFQAALGRSKADAATGRSGDQHRLALEQAVRGNVRRCGRHSEAQ
jgi:hypothetical protein